MAILQGLAPDGGLYVPEYIPKSNLSKDELLSLSQCELTARILAQLLPDFSLDTLNAAVFSGYEGKFPSDDLTPLVPLSDCNILELFHGPTSAFKDMALCLLPRLIAAACNHNGMKEDVLILTATSGDTGKAALEGFADAPQTKIAVFFPVDGVSTVQKLQMVTQEGKNVCVCSVVGNFDDAQRGVKKALNELHPENCSLSSANSINIGRLAPQVAYYFKAYAHMVKQGKIAYGDKIDVIVPTGNFGNIFAGYLAKQMGLPIGKLICASNANKVLTDFINTGFYDRRREFLKTPSPSMDILVSSNLERLLYFASGCDDKYVASLMESLDKNGYYQASDELMEVIRDSFLCGTTDNDECLSAIKSLWDEERYLMDPHTAVGYNVFKKLKADGKIENPAVVLSTASPYKFSESMLKAFDKNSSELGFDAIDKLYELTKVPVPQRLISLRDKEILHKDVIGGDEILAYIERKAGEKVWAK